MSRYLSHQIHTRILNPANLPSTLKNIRAALFPHNHPAPARIIPNHAEQRLILRRCAEALLDLIPPGIANVYFGIATPLPWLTARPFPDKETSSSMPPPQEAAREEKIRHIEDEWLAVFGDAYCNKHLMYGIVDLVLVRLMPELSEMGVEELLRDRLG